MNAGINPAMISRIVASVPERTTRRRSGTAFTLDGARGCSDPARLVNVARLLRWLAPLAPLTGEEQRALGLHAGAARPGLPPEESAAEGDDFEMRF